ncbi:hypothetical protein [Neolewinella sp.]|uniref:hypothetical protein n=1 Tax=Neolewinella sp. TaxID=2993543 RepID=UPI003B52A617
MHDDLLDDWPEQRRTGKGPRPDPIGMLFDGIPEPVIVSEEEELPIQRPFSGQLVGELIGWLTGVIAVMYLIYRVCEYFGWWGV